MDARASSQIIDHSDHEKFHSYVNQSQRRQFIAPGENKIASCLIDLLKISIIPTLLEESRNTKNHYPNPYEIASFASLCMVSDPTLATSYARQLLKNGLSITKIFDGLIAPAARHLGFLWDEDLCDFNQVTIGLSRMHHIVINFSQGSAVTSRRTPRQPTALFSSMPGSQHTLGALMASELFRGEGWNVSMKVGVTNAQLLAEVKKKSFDVIGLSISQEDDIEALRLLIRSARSRSKNPFLKILIGGPIVELICDLDRIVGADAAASDAKTVSKLANVLRVTSQ